MVQRIGGNDSSAGSSSVQDPKRQEDRQVQDRAGKFRSVLGQGQGQAKEAQKPKEGQMDPDAAARKSSPGAQIEAMAGPGRPGLAGSVGLGAQGEGTTGPAAAAGSSGPGTSSEVASALKELQAALEEM